MTEEELKVIISAQTDGLKSGLNDSLNQVNNFSTKATKSVNTMNTAFGTLSKTIAKFVSIGALIKLGKDAINVASDLIEVQNVVDTAFGDMAYKCEEFAQTSIEQFGMSELSAKQTASTYMAMAKSMGLGMESASNMAIEVAKLTGDVASFYNISQSDASTKLKSIFTGETETLKSLGVVMTETNLKEFALTQGITKSYNEMTQAERVALRYKFVMNALNDASGDFARTSDSWANQTRILSERFKQLLGIVGNGLVQVLTPFVKMLNNALSVMITFAQNIANLFGVKTQQAIASTGSAISDVSDNYEEMGDTAEESGNKAKKGLMGFDEINNLQQESESSDLGGLTSELTEIESSSSSLDKAKDKMESLSKINFNPLINSVKKLGNAFKNVFEVVKSIGSNIYDKIVAPLLKLAIEEALPETIELLANTFAILGESLRGLNWLAEESGLYDFFGKLATAIARIPIDILKVINDLLEGILTLVNPEKYPLDNNYFTNMEKDLKQVGKDVLNFGEDFTILGIRIKGFKALYEGLKLDELFHYALEKQKEDWLNLKNLFVDFWNAIPVKVSEIMGKVTDTFEDFKTSLKDIWSGIKSIIKDSINLIIGYVNGMLDGTKTALNYIIDKINSLSWEVPDWVPGIGGQTWGFNIPNVSWGRIPELERGGIVDKATTFIAGEHGKEAIVPLENNTEWMDKMASRVVGMMNAVNSMNSNSVTINLETKLNSKVVASETIKDLNIESVRRGYKPILNT